jgi:hypothetical protein
MFTGMSTFTLVHVVISLVGIASGLVVLLGLVAGQRLEGWTVLFLTSTVATSVTGFFLRVDHFMPSHALGILSLLALGLAIYARYGRGLAGAWRPIYAGSAVLALYFNVFVLVVQLFLKMPALKALAPNQTEPPFVATQTIVLAAFVAATIAAAIRFRERPTAA